MLSRYLNKALGVAVSGCLLSLPLIVSGGEVTFRSEQLKLPGKRGACFSLRAPDGSQKETRDDNPDGDQSIQSDEAQEYLAQAQAARKKRKP